MARLKVKQISDYVSATESLVSAGISSEISATNSDVNSLDARISTDEVGLSSEISATNSDILSVAAVAGDATALSNEVSATNSDVNSIDARVSGNASLDVLVSNQVSGILAGAGADTDNFAEVISYINSVDAAGSLDLVTELTSVDTRISTDEVALSSEISATNSDVNSIDARISADEVGLSSEISATNSDVTSIDLALSAEISATNSDILSVAGVAGDATALSNEVSATNSDVNSIDARISGDEVGLSSEVSATNSDVTSLEAQFNSFAKEPYVHGVLSDIVTGGGMTVQVLDTSGGANGDNVTDNAGTAVFDLSQPIEGANVVDFAANFAEFTINGLGIKHNALRFNSSTNVALDYTALGYNLEADDVIEYKYIKD